MRREETVDALAELVNKEVCQLILLFLWLRQIMIIFKLAGLQASFQFVLHSS